MNRPVPLEVAKLARSKLKPETATDQDVEQWARDRVYTALEIVLAAFLDEVIGELQAEQAPTPGPTTQRGGARR